jgi:hypothetical protein
LPPAEKPRRAMRFVRVRLLLEVEEVRSMGREASSRAARRRAATS